MKTKWYQIACCCYGTPRFWLSFRDGSTKKFYNKRSAVREAKRVVSEQHNKDRFYVSAKVYKITAKQI